MDVLFFAFANNSQAPLASLEEEASEIFRILSPGELEQKYILVIEKYATREIISRNLGQYKDQLALFHYSGHAEGELLVSTEENTTSSGLAYLLGQCKNLKIAVLNGCSTRGQVTGLWNAGVPNVIGTYAPVGDAKAKNFSKRFYLAMGIGMSLQQAFEQAKGEVLTFDAQLEIPIHRGLNWAAKEETKEGWGLFCKPDKELELGWKLPAKQILKATTGFETNIFLINTLMKNIAPFNRQVKNLIEAAMEGEEVDFADKRLAILNSLPAPIAEHLRKLLVPMGDSDQGYDKIGNPRIQQLCNTFSATFGLLLFSLLSQLWEVKELNRGLEVPKNILDGIRNFFDNKQQEIFPLFNLIADLSHFLQPMEKIFIRDLDYLVTVVPELQENVYYLDQIRVKAKAGQIENHEIAEICERTEKELANVLGKLSFFTRYTLTAVREINVVKFRHQTAATFRHSLVRLVKVMGGLEARNEDLAEFMDSSSILLVRKDLEKSSCLNVSPFIIDENAFDERGHEVSKIFFFHFHDIASNRYCFQYINKPEDPLLIVSPDKLQLVKAQLDAFAELFFGKVTIQQ